MTKEQKKIYDQEYRKNHKEEIRIQQKEYRERHKEEIKTQQKAYRERCEKENKFSLMKNDKIEKPKNGAKKPSKMYKKFKRVDEFRDELRTENITLSASYGTHSLNNYGIHKYFSEKNKVTIQYCE